MSTDFVEDSAGRPEAGLRPARSRSRRWRGPRGTLLCAALTLSTTACIGPPQMPEPSPDERVMLPTAPTPDAIRARIVFTALQMVGVPYRYGGETPSGFDCSGLVQYAYRSAGLSVPRNSREQRRSAHPVSLEQAEAGDLVFFQSRNWSHVGIYLGENRFVHAPSTGKTVAIASFDEAWYQRNFIGAGRLPTAELLAGDCDRHC